MGDYVRFNRSFLYGKAHHLKSLVGLKNLMQPAGRGLRTNLLPGVILQLFILGIVVSYFHAESVRQLLDRVGAFKREWGYLYASCATAFFGGLLPYGILVISGRNAKRFDVRELMFYLGFWFLKGAEVDALYRLQGVVFGQGNHWDIIAVKVLVDQFVYNPLWAAPTQMLFFLWKDSGFSFGETVRRLRSRSLRTRVFEVLVSTWLVWIPAVCLIYSLPGPLQIPLFNLVLCFWSLLLTFVARDTDTRTGMAPRHGS